MKISYSCTKNMYNILSNHNKRLLNELITKDRNPDVGSCNCRNKEECPLGGRCNSRNVVYQAYISPMDSKRMGRESIWESLREIGNKDGTTTNLHFPTQNLYTRLLYQNIFGALRIRGYLHKLSGK